MAVQLVGYLRVSSTDQNPERRVESIGPTDRSFTDYASGGSTGRPELRKRIGYARAGVRIRVVSIDRPARSTHGLHELIHFFTGEGIGVEFVQEGPKFGPGTDEPPMDQLMLATLGAIAQLECVLIREHQAE
ncbi:recombinase family protein [Leucobacter luti]|uniref:recombinase family protein n=1 Tax=Leucobacter luti TaxID=340320 RepID=UPI001414EBF7|nr:recombinase family protein [Leucobacter luti]QYM75190.1 recombinase family protein [Leucobacter luti]